MGHQGRCNCNNQYDYGDRTTAGLIAYIPYVIVTAQKREERIRDVPVPVTSVPDLSLGDLARIEVLRGPQGTLYGAESMGGLMKYVMADPATDGISRCVQVT